MRSAIVLAVALFALSSMIDAQHRPGQLPLNAGKVVCYYNSSSFIREGKLLYHFHSVKTNFIDIILSC